MRPKVPNHEILSAQYLSLYKKVSFLIFGQNVYIV